MKTRIMVIAASVLFALVVGLFGLSLFFSDFGPGETIAVRFLIAGLVFLFSGLVIGLINPRSWLLSGMVGWGGFLLSLLGMFRLEDVPLALLTLVVSLGPAFLGGYTGSLISRKYCLRRLFRQA